jgi:hypothetical protein
MSDAALVLVIIAIATLLGVAGVFVFGQSQAWW